MIGLKVSTVRSVDLPEEDLGGDIAVLAGDLPGGLDGLVIGVSASTRRAGGGGDGGGGPGDTGLCDGNELTLN